MEKSQAPLEFWFDFSSPYAYLMSEKIMSLAQKYQRKVEWHPILLGVIFKTVESKPLTQVPLKGEYSLHDFPRSARYYGIPFQMPSPFPVNSVNPARAFYALQKISPEKCIPFAQAAFQALYQKNQPIGDREVVKALLVESGVDQALLSELTALVENDEIKQTLRDANTAALAKGVFGAPFVFVNDEPFWGMDRLPFIERWLEQGGF